MLKMKRRFINLLDSTVLLMSMSLTGILAIYAILDLVSKYTQ